jgi:hypothetical protein
MSPLNVCSKPKEKEAEMLISCPQEPANGYYAEAVKFVPSTHATQ